MVKYSLGTILKIENIKGPVLVVSKDIYNETGCVIACPIIKKAPTSAVTHRIKIDKEDAYVLCDQMKNLDLNSRVSKKIGQISMMDKMIVSDIIQGVFEYI